MAFSKEIRDLVHYSMTKAAPTNYSNQEVNAALAEELQKLMKTTSGFERHKWDLYDLITENADEVVPRNVKNALEAFAEVRVIPQGTAYQFRTSRRLSRIRAKKFLTQAALAGRYRSFRLDSDTYTVALKAMGIAVRLDFERVLDGTENLAELLDVVAEAFEDSVYDEIAKALEATVANQLPAANKAVNASFDPDKMVQLCNIAKAYSDNGQAVIFATPEFIAAMGADAVVAPTATLPGVYAPQDVDAIHNTGLITMFRGNVIVPLKQSYTDIDNAKLAVNPQMAYIFPSGKEKIIKIVMEGQTNIKDDGMKEDWSRELQFYRKMGVAVEGTQVLCVYQNTSIDESTGLVA